MVLWGTRILWLEEDEGSGAWGKRSMGEAEVVHTT